MIEIEGTKIGSNHRPYIIAEVGINAWNDLRLARKFIESAAEAGADAVKFQTHFAEAEMVESEMRAIGAGEVYDTVAQCEWTVEEHHELQDHADAHDITFLSTPFSVEAVDVLAEVDVPAIKIGSGEMSNRHLVESAANTGKPLLVSTGMNTLDDIKAASTFLEEVAAEYALLYCVSEYPTSAKDFDFQTIDVLREASGSPVGFSDHSVGVEAAKIAIGNGASFIEKHFTLDRRLPGPDQEVSIEPEELSDLCRYAKLYHETSTTKEEPGEKEKKVSNWAKQSIVTNMKIKKGEEVKKSKITTKRPGKGIPAKRYKDIISKKVNKNIEEGKILKKRDIKNFE